MMKLSEDILDSFHIPAKSLYRCYFATS